MIVLLLVLLLVFGGSFGYWGHTNWGPGYGFGGGLGVILFILLIFFLIGAFDGGLGIRGLGWH